MVTNDDKLKWTIFRREMQKLRDVQQALLRIGETMVVGIWWITKTHDVVTFDPDFMDLRKGTAMNKFDHKTVDIRELLRSP